MSYVNTSLSESSFQTGISNILCNAPDKNERWTKHVEFYRVAHTDSSKPLICCAKHIILKSPTGDFFGMATTTDEFEGTDKEIYEQGVNRIMSDKRLIDLYFYTMDNYQLTQADTNHSYLTTDGVKRAALDLESFNSKLKIEHMQSPIVHVRMRKTFGETFFGNKEYSNWWEDSRVHVQGYFNAKMFFLTIQSDTSPSWEEASTPKIPIYFGRFNSFAEDNGDNVALFAGTQREHSVQPVMPLQKKYSSNPGNGLSTIIVKRGKYGARYQSHYLSWNVPPTAIPSSRDPISRKAANEINQYQFSPSVYTGAAESSIVYVLHPEDGIYGSLSNIILATHLSILDGDELEVELPGCKTAIDTYVALSIDSTSPFTTAGTNPFSPSVVAVRKNKPTVLYEKYTNY